MTPDPLLGSRHYTKLVSTGKRVLVEVLDRLGRSDDGAIWWRCVEVGENRCQLVRKTEELEPVEVAP